METTERPSNSAGSSMLQLLSPDKTIVGNSVCLVSLSAAARLFPGYTTSAMRHLLDRLAVPILHDKSGDRFNLYSLEAVLFYLLAPGSGGIALPGSKFKNAGHHDRPNSPCTRTQVSDDDLGCLHSEEWRQARLATGLNVMEIPRSLRRRKPAATPQSGGPK